MHPEQTEPIAMRDIRRADSPELKEKVISQLFGQFIGFIKASGLTENNEFAVKIDEVFQCSRKVLWIDQYRPNYNIVVYANSIQMFIEFGVSKKDGKGVIYRNKIQDLRYNISSCTDLQLIDSHMKLFHDFFNDFCEKFELLKNNYCETLIK